MSLNGLKFLNVNLVWGTYREEAYSKMGQAIASFMQLTEFCPTSPHAGKQGVKPEIKLKFHSPSKAGGFHLLIASYKMCYTTKYKFHFIYSIVPTCNFVPYSCKTQSLNLVGVSLINR